MLDPEAFVNAKALLRKHGTALRGAADDSTHVGTLQRTTNQIVDALTGKARGEPVSAPQARGSFEFFVVPRKAAGGEPVGAPSAAKIRGGLATLKAAGYDIDAVTSPRVQALAGLDITLARWKKLSDAGAPPPGQRNIDRLIEGPQRVLGSPVAGGARALVNELVAYRKSEFVRAVGEVDRAIEARSKQGKTIAEETSTLNRLFAADARLKEADRALQALSDALNQQVHDKKVDWPATLLQFQPRPPLPPGM